MTMIYLLVLLVIATYLLYFHRREKTLFIRDHYYFLRFNLITVV